MENSKINFIDAIKDELYYALTENGDKAYATSGSYCLDFFSLAGGFRHKYANLFNLYLKAFYEDKLLAIKLLFYLRDIQGGLGERNSFRFILNFLANLHPEVIKQVIEYIPKYGRFDDLFVLFNTPIEKDILEFIKNQLNEDLNNFENDKAISLLIKWLPSINTSSSGSRDLAKKMSEYLGYTSEQYRKTLAKLRKGRVLEVYLTNKDYSFDYSKQPSQAMFKYQKAFQRNDNDRYMNFVNQAEEKKNLNTTTLFPYQIVKKIREYKLTKAEKKILDVTWNNIERSETKSKTIVVLDGSGSMYYNNGAIKAIDIATSLAILFSEELTGPYKNTFITFSSKPQLVQLKSKTICDKVKEAFIYNKAENTNVTKVYDLILNTAVNKKISQEDLPERIVIISDMEFDQCINGMSTFESAKEKFINAGYRLPELVFWNVEARNIYLPVTQNEANVKLVSGASKNIITMIANNKALDPYDYMMNILRKYKEFDTIIS